MSKRHIDRYPVLLKAFDELDKFELANLKRMRGDDLDADTPSADHQATFQKLNFGDLP